MSKFKPKTRFRYGFNPDKRQEIHDFIAQETSLGVAELICEMIEQTDPKLSMQNCLEKFYEAYPELKEIF